MFLDACLLTHIVQLLGKRFYSSVEISHRVPDIFCRHYGGWNILCECSLVLLFLHMFDVWTRLAS